MTYLDELKRPPPFLELSRSTVALLRQRQLGKGKQKQKQNTSSPTAVDLDLDSVMTLWTTLANSSEYVVNGKRLENMSWRVVNRSLLLKEKFDRQDLDTLIDISTNAGQTVKIPRPQSKPQLKLPARVPSQPSYRREVNETTLEVSDSEKELESPQLTQRNLERQQSSLSSANDKVKPAPAEKQSPEQSVGEGRTLSQNQLQQRLLQRRSRQSLFYLNNSSSESSRERSKERLKEQSEKTPLPPAAVLGGSARSPTSLTMSPTMKAHTAAVGTSGTSGTATAAAKKQIETLQHPPRAKSPLSGEIASGGKATDLIDGDETTRQLYEKLKNTRDAGISPTKSERSQTSLFAPTRRATEQAASTHKIMFSDDDDDDDDDDIDDSDDWSSLSDDSEFDDGELHGEHEHQEPPLDFHKHQIPRTQSEERHVLEQRRHSGSSRQSLLTGLFVDDTVPAKDRAPALKQPINQQQRLDRLHPHMNASPKLLFSNGPADARHPTVHRLDDDSLEITTSLKPQRAATASATTVNTTVSTFSPPENPRDLLMRHTSNNNIPEPRARSSLSGASGRGQHQPHEPQQAQRGGDGLPGLVSKSALSLASFFSNNRRPHAATEDHYDRHHQSNAPPTATTLLPTALATHMFLPTMNLQQQAKARNRDNQMRLARRRQLEKDDSISKEDADRSPTVADHGHDHDGEYSSSIKTNTSSIDIPGSMKRREKEERENLRRQQQQQQEIQRRRSSAASVASAVSAASTAASTASIQVHRVPSRDDRPGFDRANSGAISPKSTRLRMLSKELPLKLMDSINNENKLFYNQHDSRLKRASIAAHDADFDKGTQRAPEEKGGESTVEDDSSSVEPSSDTRTGESASGGGNMIADGIMGNKLRLVRSAKKKSYVPANGGLMYNDDGYVDDRLVQLKAQVAANGGQPESWEEDNLNYHARGW